MLKTTESMLFAELIRMKVVERKCRMFNTIASDLSRYLDLAASDAAFFKCFISTLRRLMLTNLVRKKTPVVERLHTISSAPLLENTFRKLFIPMVEIDFPHNQDGHFYI